MAIIFNPNKKIFTLQTAHTTYQMQVDRLGYLLHLYYGAKSTCDMDYVLTYADRGFSGNPYAAGMRRTYSLATLPQEYPAQAYSEILRLISKTNRALRVLSFLIRVMKSETENTL